ncbi:ABC transporter substrate-binding protein [Ruania alba]|uniref:Carbohydrate ABC transporter substrate-binding protein, CUT1 family n=1 Tax=Ruania alba TaxID=648782 RepID=A0A1H5N864_9MICO|nr:sugar ABC transporter substrate-binding protein [Ruania alba]SEE97650.1 carbohydrate ABC transporter substrate-binding protein, CUT1 family [Ruania alba]
MVHRRSVPALASLALAGLALAACTSGGTDGATPDPADGSVDLRMTVWTSDEGHLALFDEIADGYIEENPELVSSVTFETVPFDDYTSTLTTQLAGGNTPDLGWVFESNAPEFVSSGALTDVRPALAGSEGYEFDDIVPSALDLWSEGEGLYAYPFSNSPFVMFVNTDRIAESGQDDPADLVSSDEWTWDSARDISAASAEQLGGAGLVVRDFDYSDWGNLATVWGGWDAAPWSEDGTTCTFTDPAMVDAMTWIHDAAFADGAMPGPGTSADFFAGDVTMTVTQISRAAALDGSFEWDVLPLPAGPAGQQNIIGQAGVGVFENGENPEIAADFLAHFTSPESAEQLATYFPPPRESLLNAQTLADANPLLSEDQLESVVVGGITDAITKPAHPNFAQLQTTIRGELDALWTADADVEAVLANVCSAADPLLQD